MKFWSSNLQKIEIWNLPVGFGDIIILTQKMIFLMQKLSKKGYFYEPLVEAYGDRLNIENKK